MMPFWFPLSLLLALLSLDVTAIGQFMVSRPIVVGPLVGLVAIISGIHMFGILGVFIGPILAAMLLSLLKTWPVIGGRFGMDSEPAPVDVPPGG